MCDRRRLRVTPFHACAAAANRDNAWLTRNEMTLAERYEGVEHEALGARLNVAIADISWRWRVMLEGPAAESLLPKLVTRDVSRLSPGEALKALWLADEGGVRGAGVVARFDKESFLLVASAPDREWIAAAAAVFGVRIREIWEETGGLAVIGPYARAVLKAAALDADLELLAFRRLSWGSLDVMLSRWGEHGGYEIWCNPDDSLLVWDRLMHAGVPYGIMPAGVAAMDLLDLETGIARPHLDYVPARDGNDAEPVVSSLGLEALVDTAHKGFNGRKAFLISNSTRKLVGIEIESDKPAPFTPLSFCEKSVGHTLRSFYSPALRRAIALASVDAAAAKTGTVLSLMLPPSFAAPVLHRASARVASLPFLPIQIPIEV